MNRTQQAVREFPRSADWRERVQFAVEGARHLNRDPVRRVQHVLETCPWPERSFWRDVLAVLTGQDPTKPMRGED